MYQQRIEKARDLKGILKAFRPDPLREDELDEFFHAHTMAIRMGDETLSPLKRLFEACTTPSSNNAHLFMGHMGCGKSTELNNLKRKLEADGHMVWMVDTDIETDQFQMNYWDILLLATEVLWLTVFSALLASCLLTEDNSSETEDNEVTLFLTSPMGCLNVSISLLK